MGCKGIKSELNSTLFDCYVRNPTQKATPFSCDYLRNQIKVSFNYDIKFDNIEHIDNKEKVIGSMDVKALYPSLDIGFTTEIVCEEFFNSDVKIENVDYAEMGLYLRLNKDDKYIRENKLEEICPKRKHKNGRPKITSNGVVVDKDKRWKIWEEPEREPNEVEKRIMIKESLKIALGMIMNNHTYKFEEVIRKQKEGGAIGIDLTGEMARIFMCWWDRQTILLSHYCHII